MDRRVFLGSLTGGPLLATGITDANPSGRQQQGTFGTPFPEGGESGGDHPPIPNFCAHEHWGSIASIGMAPEGFRADAEAGALPARRTTLLDLLIDPYLGGWMAAAGFNAADIARKFGKADLQSAWIDSPDQVFNEIRPHLERQRLTGVFQCLRRGITLLHGHDIGSLDLEAWKAADQSIAMRYESLFQWYRKAMEQAGFSELIRPVHPSFFTRSQSDSSAQEELSFTHTILRIDPLLGLWTTDSQKRDKMAETFGVEPVDAASWRKLILAIFDAAAQKGTTGIKQLQAYSRSLDFQEADESQVAWVGDLTPYQVTTFKNWVVNECCRQAHERGWPHQIHVGTHNLSKSSPLPLEFLAKRYPRMKLVLIHCWPFIDESGWLAKYLPNVYLDTCWQTVLNPDFFRRALKAWLGYVPHHKIMCSHDSTSLEMAAGSSLFTREILAEELGEHAGVLQIPHKDMSQLAAGFLHNNAVDVYGIGTVFQVD